MSDALPTVCAQLICQPCFFLLPPYLQSPRGVSAARARAPAGGSPPAGAPQLPRRIPAAQVPNGPAGAHSALAEPNGPSHECRPVVEL